MTTYDRTGNPVFLDFSFYLPLDERIRAEHIQDAIRECCNIRNDEGRVLVDEFAPTDTNDALCVKGYVETTQHEGGRIMNSLKAQFGRDTITEYLMNVLQIESPVLRAENFTCRFSSEGPEQYTDLLELDTSLPIEQIEEQPHDDEDDNERDNRNIQRNINGNVNASNKINRNNNNNAKDPTLSQNIVPNDEMHASETFAGNDDNMYLVDDSEFDDPNVPLEKKFENFRKLLEHFMDDCERMYDQLLQECDNQTQQNY